MESITGNTFEDRGRRMELNAQLQQIYSERLAFDSWIIAKLELATY